MAKVVYSLAGEGRGHATRSKTIIDQLVKRGHRVYVFAPAVAYELLSEVYQDSERVFVEEIPGLVFHYRNERVDFAGTTLGTIEYVRGLPLLVSRLQNRLDQIEPDLAITDFEPALPRAAKLAGVPWISVNHQHFLVVSDFHSLPRSLRTKAWLMSKVVGQYYRDPAKMVVSSFYFPPLKERYRDTVQTGVLLRDQVVNAVPEKHDHVVAYLRRFATEKMLDSLANCGSRVKVYGLGERPRLGSIEFCPISNSGFLEDLRTCKALVSSAGNQLVGEALFLKKPVLVFPEAKNFEQEINARYLEQSGGGTWVGYSEFGENVMREFLESLSQFQCNIPREALNGNTRTMQVIDHFLPTPKRTPIFSQQLAVAGV
ncbi:glycosyltransferase family protein [Thalassoglobus sp. JC818]|uniref:glycosyltransferase family protein n=1 Tax=Thalassoglobus sp. JC818 TaxID=3232136 RepID=UPI00345ACE26